MERPMTHELRTQIALYIKNRLDISELIAGVDIRSMDLSGSIIKKLDKSNCNISNCNFCGALIGGDNEVIRLTNAIAKNCNFKRAKFLSKVMARRIDARDSNFYCTYMPYIDYRYADLRGCNFCECIFSLGTAKSYGASFSPEFFQDLASFWNIEINIKSVEEKHDQRRNEEQN